MVEKIDRPDVVPAYQVVATTGAKDRQGQSQQQPQQEDEFSSPGTPQEWRAFQTRTNDRQLLRFQREHIRRIGFRKILLSRSTIIVEADLELTSGKVWHGAQFLVPRLDELIQWKGYAPGQDVPLPALLHEPVIEVSVPQQITETEKKPSAGMRPAEKIPLPERDWGNAKHWIRPIRHLTWMLTHSGRDERRLLYLAMAIVATILLVIVTTAL